MEENDATDAGVVMQKEVGGGVVNILVFLIHFYLTIVFNVTSYSLGSLPYGILCLSIRNLVRRVTLSLPLRRGLVA